MTWSHFGSLPVDVDQKIAVSVKGQSRNLSFSTGDEQQTAFRRRPSGFALVTRKASLMV